MLEISSSGWAWSSGPWVTPISCQADTSFLFRSLLTRARKLAFKGKMPKMLLKNSSVRLKTLQGSAQASLLQYRRSSFSNTTLNTCLS